MSGYAKGAAPSGPFSIPRPDHIRAAQSSLSRCQIHFEALHFWFTQTNEPRQTSSTLAAVLIMRVGTRRTGNKYLLGRSATTKKIESASTKSVKNVTGCKSERRNSCPAQGPQPLHRRACQKDLTEINARGSAWYDFDPVT
jgi:hypothetical protein